MMTGTFGIIVFGALTGVLAAVVIACLHPSLDVGLTATLRSSDGVKTTKVDLGLEGSNWRLQNANGSIDLPGVTVPGNMYTALMGAGVIGDPYFRFNDDVYRWVHWDNWTYSTSFTGSAEMVGSALTQLVCDGLDTVATVYVNGQEVGSSVNQFVRYVYDITAILVEGANQLEVSFRSAPDYAQQQSATHAYRIPPDCPPDEYHPECHANFIRKAQCSFSWDWGPAFATQGIWLGIHIESFDGATIRDVIPTPSKDDANGLWLLNVTTSFDVAEESFEGTLGLLILGTSLQQTSGISLSRGASQDVSLVMQVPQDQVQPWWPRGYGNPNLYDLQVTLRDIRGAILENTVITTGFRTIEMVQDDITNGLTMYFKINDVPIFMKGSNWIPSDSFQDRVTSNKLRQLLQDAVDANMNSIRIWGGGIYEVDEFYDLADELGLLIWQDMMFACSMYPVDDPFLDTVAQEISYQVRRLGRHPSVMAWTANNENEGALVDNWYGTAGALYPQYKEDYVTLYIDTVRSNILAEDTSRPFLSSSPTNGDVTEDNGWISEDPRPSSPDYGDVHYYNYVDDCLDYTIYPRNRYASEYGFQSWPSYTTLLKAANPDDLYSGSPFCVHREHNSGGGNGTDQLVRRHFDLPDTGDIYQDFRGYIYLTQIMQSMCYKTETESYRRLRSDPDVMTMGALYWQHNDIWQAPTWATTDYYGNWKMAHYYAMRFFADPIVSSVEVGGSTLEVYTVTDSLQGFSGTQVVLQLWGWTSTPGQPLLTWTLPGDVVAASSQLVYSRPVDDLLAEGGCPDRTQCVLALYIQDSSADRISPVSTHWLTSPKDAVGISVPNVLVSDITEIDSREFQVTLTSDRVAPFVWLEAVDISGRFSDNGFLLVESPTAPLTFYALEDITLSELQGALTVNTLANIY